MNRIDEPEGQGDERTWTPESGEDFERASENVLDGWPASPAAPTEGEESVELPASYEAEAARTRPRLNPSRTSTIRTPTGCSPTSSTRRTPSSRP